MKGLALEKCKRCGVPERYRVFEVLGQKLKISVPGCDCTYKEYMEDKVKRVIYGYLRESGIPKDRWIDELQDWNDTEVEVHGRRDKLIRYANDYVSNYQENKKSGKGFLVQGKVGRGKTRICWWILTNLVTKYQERVYYINCAELYGIFKKAERGEADLGIYRNVPVLMIDDIGETTLESWFKRDLTNIVDYRLRSKKVLIVNTMRSVSDLEKKYLGEHIVSRLIEACGEYLIEIKGGKDWRKEKYKSEEVANE